MFAVITLRFKQRGFSIDTFCSQGAVGMANSADPDQTAPVTESEEQSDLGLNCPLWPVCLKTEYWL